MTGCTHISEGCYRCYAERLARRLKGINPKYANAFKPTVHKNALEEPLSWKRSRRVFVCSMGDLFHEDVPDDFVKDVFDVMRRAKAHVFQVLTKRSVRMLEMTKKMELTPNIWVGVTVESGQHLNRIKDLTRVSAQVKFLSCEPLLSKIDNLPLDGVDWVIVGGESGRGCRPMEAAWVRSIRDTCVSRSVAFFFKQWGGINRKAAGRQLDGRQWDEMPDQ
jgi:protein gp37